MKTIKLAVLPFPAAVLLGGCIGIELTEDDEVLDGQSQAWEHTAEAASAVSTKHCIPGACATFETFGDHLFVEDTAADGKGAVGDMKGRSPCYNSSGRGSVRDCNYNFPEGGTVEFRVCLGDSGRVLWYTCSGWVRASN